jgi:MOSC domain-containing protein YiiM
MEPLDQAPDASTVPGWTGRVAGVFIAAAAADPMQPVAEVSAVPGRGLAGDRYFERTGTFSDQPATGREVTLIESEAVEAANRDDGLDLAPGDARRNIVTVGVPLNHLVGREFLVGEVRLRGMRLNEPCSHLAGLTGQPVVKALVHRGGLRADIVEGGTIRVGDPIRPLDNSPRPRTRSARDDPSPQVTPHVSDS